VGKTVVFILGLRVPLWCFDKSIESGSLEKHEKISRWKVSGI